MNDLPTKAEKTIYWLFQFSTDIVYCPTVCYTGNALYVLASNIMLIKNIIIIFGKLFLETGNRKIFTQPLKEVDWTQEGETRINVGDRRLRTLPGFRPVLHTKSDVSVRNRSLDSEPVWLKAGDWSCYSEGRGWQSEWSRGGENGRTVTICTWELD